MKFSVIGSSLAFSGMALSAAINQRGSTDIVDGRGLPIWAPVPGECELCIAGCLASTYNLPGFRYMSTPFPFAKENMFMMCGESCGLTNKCSIGIQATSILPDWTKMWDYMASVGLLN
ncbi:hypothetical protein BS50DRAFT_594805 [Corynespora cassiicola Philippines]|uniref:Uncharacterized protein n=1 Tax=Corynespora cassiicola Philippines TaxID=1448308 RepID=A0A2T2N2I5_CORCC|nr:hypothetical protein BS50DRAFT_594805 [Corynespora cassiicola Philippines]